MDLLNVQFRIIWHCGVCDKSSLCILKLFEENNLFKYPDKSMQGKMVLKLKS